MANKKLGIFILIAATLAMHTSASLPTYTVGDNNIPGELKSAGPTGPKEYIVGDDKGWAVGVDYKAWLEGKEINVGDKLVFKYPVGTQNVYKVHESLYNDCIIPTPDQPLTTGQDYVSIPGPGEFGFLSSVDNNCQKGVKLLIKVECPLKKKVQGGRKLVPPTL